MEAKTRHHHLTKMSLFLHFISYNVQFPRQIPISVDDFLIFPQHSINEKKMKSTEITTWQELISFSMPVSIYSEATKLYTAQNITEGRLICDVMWVLDLFQEALTQNFGLPPSWNLVSYTFIGVSLNNLMLNAFSNALEYCREAIFQSPPVFIIALNSPKLIRPSFTKQTKQLDMQNQKVQVLLHTCSYLIQVNII